MLAYEIVEFEEKLPSMVCIKLFNYLINIIVIVEFFRHCKLVQLKQMSKFQFVPLLEDKFSLIMKTFAILYQSLTAYAV